MISAVKQAVFKPKNSIFVIIRTITGAYIKPSFFLYFTAWKDMMNMYTSSL